MAVSAHVPGSVTVVFVPQEGRRSLGVSFATADGAQVTVERAPETVVFLDGRPATVAAVSGVLRRLGLTATVRIDPEVPIGCGFGVSGAATLGAALAANAEWGLGHDREALVRAAHRAEVQAGTGLGDVFIQDTGGLVWDRGQGLERATPTARIEYASFGGIATTDVLGDEAAVQTVRTVGREALADLNPTEGLAPLFDAAWTFAARTGLATEQVEHAVKDVQEEGGSATMAMVGETVVASGAEGIFDRATHLTDTGAELQ